MRDRFVCVGTSGFAHACHVDTPWPLPIQQFRSGCHCTETTCHFFVDVGNIIIYRCMIASTMPLESNSLATGGDLMAYDYAERLPALSRSRPNSIM